MEKVYGATGRQDGLYKIGRNKWELIYGFGKDSEQEQTGWNYRQRFSSKPSLDEIKEIVTAQIEADYTEKLMAGFEWNGKCVEYSEERKSDFTGLITGLQSGLFQLPLTINLSDTALVLHEFASIEEIGEVAAGICAHKTAVTNAKWQEKSSINWESEIWNGAQQ